MSDIALEFKKVSKKFKKGEKYNSLRDLIPALTKRVFSGNHGEELQEKEFWALKDVSLQVKKGEAFGIIGPNGAGKSTILKLLSGILRPNRGEIKVNGRLSALIEVGAGFHQDLTGRENVYLNGAILGMKRTEIDNKFDEIVEFAGLEEFIDTPVKRYSSGMHARLGFSVAAHLEPEILLVDEVLAVGDAQFQKKCLGKMETSSKIEGRTVLFVSHNMAAIRTLCSRVALLNNGIISGIGEPDFFIKEYLSHNNTTNSSWKRDSKSKLNGGIFFEEVRIENRDGQISDTLSSIDPFYIVLKVYSTSNISNTQIAIRVTNQEGVVLFTTTNCDSLGYLREMKKGIYVFRVNFPGNYFPPGQYSIIAAAFIPRFRLYDAVEGKLGFKIEDMGSHATLMKDGRLGVVTPIFAWDEL